jgi:hypothetical protein
VVENQAPVVEYKSRLKLPQQFNRLARVPPMTRLRIALALAIAVIADGLQFFLGPLGWPGADQAIDVVAMGLTSWVIGFHWLLLPTFALEFIPLLDALPTWTACVIAVIALRKRGQRTPPAGPGPGQPSDWTPG